MSYDYDDALFEAMRLVLDQDFPVEICTGAEVCCRAALMAGLDSDIDRAD